ncbi:MAG: hypothetical protein CO159_02280 [Candidatus Portnoybacteria bacterium CG_4_9_14_3_um_filter_40_10]|uniref:Uncharacterized protein n=1 Tax=Candidatus Portnoybacteria bacterium CG_4_9_14_3_um_filter_40_10 TaxID=1974804 RepID=A0A2M7YNN0_9BACT|nr:MAG: hypothetical protein CO159_02280 [Candidatus Portnoybacteria bacterium CG_4_9_14_3_um_filter_40_10]
MWITQFFLGRLYYIIEIDRTGSEYNPLVIPAKAGIQANKAKSGFRVKPGMTAREHIAFYLIWGICAVYSL